MRFPRIVFLYVGREVGAYTLLGLVAITSVLLSQNLLRRLDELTMAGFTGDDFTAALRCLVPPLIAYAAPVAFLFGVLLAVRRLSSDSEILALRSCGLGLRSLVVPTLVLAGLGVGVCAWLMISVEHRARLELLGLFKSIAARGAILEPGRFREFGGRILYVEGRDRENQLEGVMIFDYSNPARQLRIFAQRGRFQFDDATDLGHIRLESGDIHLDPPHDEPERYRRISFDSFDYRFDLGALTDRGLSPVRPKQMTLTELRAVIARAATGDDLFGLDEREPTEYALEIHRRFALPLAPLLFGLVALPRGLRAAESGRSWGVLQGAAVVVGWYSLLAFSQLLARAGWLSAPLALWLPTVTFAALGVGLLRWESGRIAA